MKVTVTKENGAFAIEASEIKTKEDVQEVIRQLQLVEGQMVDGLGLLSTDRPINLTGSFFIADKLISRSILPK